MIGERDSLNKHVIRYSGTWIEFWRFFSLI